MSCSDVLTKLYHTIQKQFPIGEDEIDDPTIRCTYCTRQERVLNFQTLGPGDHISVGGEHGMKNIKFQQKSIYKHHAIVKEIELLSHDSCNATLIHFYTTPFDSHIKIQETTEHLTLSYHEINKVKYCHQTHSSETIIKRAEELLNSKEQYSRLECNCEHICHWCCIGKKASFQVISWISFFRQIATAVLSIGLPKPICKFLAFSLDEALSAGIQTTQNVLVPLGVIGFFVCLNILFCIYKNYQFNKNAKLGEMCARCCFKEKFDLWLNVVIQISTQVGGLRLLSIITNAFSGKVVSVSCTILTSILTIYLMHWVPKLREKFCTPFRGTTVQLKSTQDMLVGDVVSFPHGMTMNDGIISKMQMLTEKRAKVSIVHYSKAFVYGRRRVEEIEFVFDLSRDKIMGHDYSCYDVHPPEQVVSRVRQRIGETKYGLVSNRSCHLCHWAKVKDVAEKISTYKSHKPFLEMRYVKDIKQGEDISDCKRINVDHKKGRKHASKLLETTWARIPEEIKAGEIIQFKYGKIGRWHSAVATDVCCCSEHPQKVSVTVVHYGRSNILCEEKFEFDLRFQDVWIHKYHPSFRYSRSEVIRRARARVGIAKYHIWYNNSSHLAQNVVENDTDQMINNFSELKPGDVIIFYYWSLKHAAVLTNIDNQYSKPNNTAYVTIIHYALDGFFETRTVKEETIFMDLSKDMVYRRNYAGYTPYPPQMVIRRARRRINEQRFSAFSNTSWDLVHWAKVIQRPAYVEIKCQDKTGQETLKPVETNNVLIPKVGNNVEMFQCLPVYGWRDLQPGIILDFRYYLFSHKGIITDVDFKRSTVTVIHYGTDTLVSKRTIMSETIRVNIKRENLWVYICNPEVCDIPEMVVQRAFDRLGEQQWGIGNTSWDFCKSCVLKKKEKK